jgi:hypothetical protein
MGPSSCGRAARSFARVTLGVSRARHGERLPLSALQGAATACLSPIVHSQIDRRLVTAGAAVSSLIADPKAWINRRVETIELLSSEETRRRVSIDFTLSDARLQSLWVEGEGIVVPIALLTKERRRTFDLSDESGRAVPALGFQENGDLSMLALLGAASSALPAEVDGEQLAELVPDLREMVFDRPVSARDAYERLARRATSGTWQEQVHADPAFRSLLDTLWGSYALFVVLPRGGPNRRILKLGYSEDVDLAPASSGWRTRLRTGGLGAELGWRVRYPDRRDFLIRCPGAWCARSFHAEVVIPEELRFTDAVLQDFDQGCRDISENEQDVHRAALYAIDGVQPTQDVVAVVQIAPGPGGGTSQASVTSIVVALVLWLGVASGLDVESPDATVSIVLGGVALYAGVTAALGESRLVSVIFRTTRRWLSVVTLSALVGSASLALEVPSAHPVGIWSAAAVLCTIAAARLAWSSFRAGAKRPRGVRRSQAYVIGAAERRPQHIELSPPRPHPGGLSCVPLREPVKPTAADVSLVCALQEVLRSG